jgi:hypothetical protein
VEEAAAHPEVFAGKSIGQVADHFETIIRGLDRKPAIVGHYFGGLAAASVAIDPAPFRGVLPLPISTLKSSFPVLGNPANRNRAVPLTWWSCCSTRRGCAATQSQPSVVAARSRVAATAWSPSTRCGTESGSRRLPSR